MGVIPSLLPRIQGLKFSPMSLAQTFRDLIFEDCVRARCSLTLNAQYVVQE